MRNTFSRRRRYVQSVPIGASKARGHRGRAARAARSLAVLSVLKSRGGHDQSIRRRWGADRHVVMRKRERYYECCSAPHFPTESLGSFGTCVARAPMGGSRDADIRHEFRESKTTCKRRRKRGIRRRGERGLSSTDNASAAADDQSAGADLAVTLLDTSKAQTQQLPQTTLSQQ